MIDYSFLGSGARARAMGGAFTGLADDASALTWNPAGLVQVDKTQASIAGVYLPLKLNTSLHYAASASHNIDTQYKDEKLKPNFASFVAPIRIKGHPFMASATYQSQQDQLDDQYSVATASYSALVNQSRIPIVAPFESRKTMSGGLDAILLGFGTGLYGNLSFGGSVNVYTGTTESFFRGQLNKVVPYVFGGSVLDSVSFTAERSVFDKAKTSGFNFTLSTLYRADKFRVGVALKTPFQMITDHDLIRRDTIYQKSVRVPGSGSADGDLNTLYRGKTKIDIPLQGTVGLSYMVTPNLIVSGDLGYAGYSKSKYLVRTEQRPRNSQDSISTFTLPNSMYFVDTDSTSFYNSAGKYIEIFNTFDLKLDNSMQFRVGGEYVLKTKVGTIPIRAGYRLVQGPYREVSQVVRDLNGHPEYQPDSIPAVQFVLGNKVNHSVVSFGTGIHWRQIWLDFAMEYNNEKQMEAGTAEWGAFTTEKKRNGPAVTFNFTGFF
jgi:long-subunit fatty acid transport protein